LLTANVDSAANSVSYGYDQYGNRTSATAGGSAARCVGNTDCNVSPSIDPDTNHINSAGATYDAAGNLTALNAGTTFTYDAMSMLTSDNTPATQAIYTADAAR